MVYTDLRAAIQEYCECNENTFAERVDTFIRQAENRIAHMVRLPPFRKQQQGTFTAGSRFLSPPSDYLAPDSLFVTVDNEAQPLMNKEPEFIYQCYPGADLGVPRFYAKIDDTTLVVGPVPDQNYPALLNYFAYAQSITTSPTGRSYMGDRCESLLLYASLVEAYTFLKGESDLLQFYDTKFKEAAGLFKQLGDGRARKDSYQEPDKRVEV